MKPVGRPAAYHAAGDRVVHELVGGLNGPSDPMARGHHGGLPGPRGRPAGQHSAGQGQAAPEFAVQPPHRLPEVHQPEGEHLMPPMAPSSPLGADARRDEHDRIPVHLRAPVPPGLALCGHHRVRLRALLRHLRDRAAVRRLSRGAPGAAADAEPAALPPATTEDHQQRHVDGRAETAAGGLGRLDHLAAGSEQGRRGRRVPAVDRQHPRHGVEPHLTTPTRWPAPRCTRSNWRTSATTRRTARASSTCSRSPPATRFPPVRP